LLVLPPNSPLYYYHYYYIKIVHMSENMQYLSF
jgi:hypothetical protein